MAGFILEFSIPPDRRLRAFHHLYFSRIMPLFGQWVTGSRAPFTYLAESVSVFSPPEDLKKRIRRAGFSRVEFKRLTSGIVTAYYAQKHDIYPPARA